MRNLVVFVILLSSWAGAQSGRGPERAEHGHGWDIRLAVPGEPGSDYPTLGNIPRTSFTCGGKEPGYYADVEAGCQVFRVCTVGSTYGFQSFLCPNGTLFNQDVFVCDWWMNVKCRPYDNASTKDKFGNLRLGPQLMKDIKKMLTHTMRNPYDKTSMKSNLIVMQDYKPPAGQLFPIGALIAGPERTPNNVYVPAKQILQPNYNQNFETNDIAFAASTPETRYVPAAFSTRPLNNEAEIFQRQRQNAQYVQNNVQTTPHSQIGNIVQNSQPQNTQLRVNETPQLRSNSNQNQQNSQRTNAGSRTIQRSELNRQRAQYTDAKKTQYSVGKQNDANSYTKQQYNQEKQPYTYRSPTQTQTNVNTGNNKELKQNLVSPISPTPVRKTLAASKTIQNPKPGRPKSRITVKTWIVKPSKSGRLLAEPAPYTYNRPTQPSQPPTERLVSEPSSYVYNRPTTPPQLERVVTRESPQPYVYNRPTTAQPERLVTEEPKPYVYNRPTVAAKQILNFRSEPDRSYLPPPTAASRPSTTQAARLIQTPSQPSPTQPSRVILTPTTFKPNARLYLPPPRSSPILSRQYLAPVQQTPYYQSSQLRATPTNPTPTYPQSRGDNPSTSITDQPRVSNNLSFTDILTKEKLDLTVNDIVRDTGNILQTASPPRFLQFGQDLNSPEEKYLPTEPDEDSGEKLTPVPPTATTPAKSARIIAQPARSLEPPVEILDSNQNTNQIAMLPFFKETSVPSVPNTIERTVSLKITIPEKLASYIFNRGNNESDFDKLEILNTGSSNYLVLSNNLENRDENDIIQINNKNSNVSNSQALVFSILVDSLNAAKKYSNIVKQDILSSTTTQAPPTQNFNNEDLTQIADKVSQLTSSQYSAQNNFNSVNLGTKSSNTNPNGQLRTSAKYTNSEQNSQTPSTEFEIVPSLQTQNQLYSSQYQTDNNLNDQFTNPRVYSGQLYQLPVPEVTNQIYNRPQSANIVRTNQQKETQISNTPQNTNSQQITNQNNVANRNNLVKQSSAEVEIVRSESSPLNPAKLQLAPANEPESFYSQESLNSLLNTDSGISAQLQDKIVGVIPHPIEDNKYLSYEKANSYYLYTKLDSNPTNVVPTGNNLRYGQGSTPPNFITFQFVPSVSYQLEDEKEQQKLLNTFQIDEFGAPRDIMRANLVQGSSQQSPTLVSSVDYTIQHPPSKQQSPLTVLYKGPSSYSAPQGSVGSLSRQNQLPDTFSSRLELNEDSNSEGYPKTTPTRRFIF